MTADVGKIYPPAPAGQTSPCRARLQSVSGRHIDVPLEKVKHCFSILHWTHPCACPVPGWEIDKEETNSGCGRIRNSTGRRGGERTRKAESSAAKAQGWRNVDPLHRVQDQVTSRVQAGSINVDDEWEARQEGVLNLW